MGLVYNVAVIGGGPGGYCAAIKAAQLGGKVVVFEKETVGGTCLNTGCIPTKCLLEKGVLIDKIKKNTRNGILKEAGLYSWMKIQEHKNATVKKLTGGIKAILSSYDIEVVQGQAEIKTAGIITVQSKLYEANKIILATGSVSYVPPIKGAEGRNVLTSTKALSLPKVPRKMVIIGGGVIGLEFASIYNAFETEVIVIEMLKDILPEEDRETVSYLKKELEKRGIRFITGAKVEAIKDAENTKAVTYTKDDIAGICSGDYILMAVGRRPNTEGILLEGLVKNSQGYINVNDKLETSVPNVYAVGDAAGGYQLAHAAYAEGETAAFNCMSGEPKAVDVGIMPRCIYCIPQYAAVGKTEEQLQKEGMEITKSLLPYASNGKALAADEENGIVKVLTDKASGVVVGVHIMGGCATELLASGLIAVNKGLTVTDFQKMIFPHPTMSELMKESVLAADKKAIHVLKPGVNK